MQKSTIALAGVIADLLLAFAVFSLSGAAGESRLVIIQARGIGIRRRST